MSEAAPSGFDFGIGGRRALVCGSSKGLGKACALSLAKAGARVILNGRTSASLAETAGDIAETAKMPVDQIVADVTTEAGRAAVLKSFPDIDILVTNAAGPPPGTYLDWDEHVWRSAVDANMIAPIQLMRHIIPGMVDRRWGRIINIASSAVKAPLPLLGLSNGARAGLTGFVAGLARDVARHGITINNLLPGRFATDRLHSYVAAVAKGKGTTIDREWQTIADANPTGRIGSPEEFGAFCLFIASHQAGYLTGQNILLDGGEYPGVF